MEPKKGKMANTTIDFLRELWLELLALDKVMDQDDFFDLGGHSVAAAIMQSELEDELDMELPLSLIFQNPTLAKMSSAIDELVAADS